MQLRRRVEKLEARGRALDASGRVVVQVGYTPKLPPGYVGPRHLVERSRIPSNVLGGLLYEWEEVEGEAPADASQDASPLIRVQIADIVPYKLGDALRELQAGLPN